MERLLALLGNAVQFAYSCWDRIVVTGGLVLFQGHVVSRTKSRAIAADRAHYAADVVMNVALIVALILTKLTGWERVDPVFAKPREQFGAHVDGRAPGDVVEQDGLVGRP